MKKTLLLTLMAILGVCYTGYSQLALGEIAFTGYWSFDGTNNKNDFSFVILKAGGIASGTTIYFTDGGYNGSTFSTSEGTVTWTSSSAMAQFSEVKIDVADAGTSATASVGTLNSVTGTFILSGAGDQIFAFNNSSFTTANLLTGIHANVENGSFVTNPTDWDLITSSGIGGCGSCLTLTSSRSTKPSVLTSGSNAIFMAGGTSTPYTEFDNGKYGCTGASGSSLSAVQSAINDPANWTLTDANTVSLPSGCSFAVSTTTTWNGSTWSAGTPSSTTDAIIASSTTPGSFTCKALTINSGVALTINSGATANINGNLTNNGNGISGVGTINFAASGSLSGNAISISGAITVASGATLTTGGLLTIKSDATNTGSIGNSAGTISGNVTVERYIPGGRRAFRFFSHPMSTSQALSSLIDDIDITGSGGSTNGFTNTSTNNPSAYWFDVTTADGSTTGNNPGWTAFTNTNGSGANAWGQYQAIRVLARGAKGEGLTSGAYTPSAATLDLTGTVNQGTQTVTITKGSGTTFGFVGNPFACAVDLNTCSRGSNVGANFYVWNPSAGTRGAYVTNAFSSSYILPAYSGFFTTVSANTNNTIAFEEVDKSLSASSGTVFKTTGSLANGVLLHLYSDGDTLDWDQMRIYFDNVGTADSDWYDAIKLYNPDASMYSFSKDSKMLAIDVRPYLENEVIPMGLTYAPLKTYTLRVDEADMPAGTKLMLTDKYLNKTVELKAGGSYVFDVTSDTLTQGNNRFELNTVGKPTGIVKMNVPQGSLEVKLIPNPANEKVILQYNTTVQDVITVQITDMSGKVVYSERNRAQATGDISISLNGFAPGVYIVEAKCGLSAVKQKLIKY